MAEKCATLHPSSTFWIIICSAVLCSTFSPVFAKPFRDAPDTHSGIAGSEQSVWIIATLAGAVCLTFSLAVCVCCRKPKGFAEFRGSTQLAELSPATAVQPGEVTLFPPPSLSLDREDQDVSFEPLPKPSSQAVSIYRPKEVTEWIESGHGLLPRYNIQYLREIGRGWFGQVVEAEVKDLVIPGQQEKGAEAGSSTRCVVKILRPESAASQHSKFLRDVQPLLKLSGHPHVLKLYGACLEASPLLVLLQHCPNGDLKQFLSAYSPSRGSHGLPPLPENVLLRLAWEAAEGLAAWHQAGLCHPDVAARSYLVTGDMRVVLGDYGTHTVAYRDDFVDTGQQLLPIRWCSPECFQPSGDVIIHTQAGNVWSFGVVLWEILSLGERPYASLTDEQVVQQVLQEKRTILNPPAYNYQQGQSVYQLMLQCWELVAPSRPKTDVILSRLAADCTASSRDVESDLEKAFDARWDAAGRLSSPSAGENGERQSPSASMNNLHGSLDNLEERTSAEKDVVLSPGTDQSESNYSAKVSAALRSLDEALAAAEATDDDEEAEEEEEEPLPEPEFRLGVEEDRPVVQTEQDEDAHSNGSYAETSDLFSLQSDWRDKIVRGELTALVREKSRSVQDLMILTHVEPMSDVEFLTSSQQQQPQPQARQAADGEETARSDHPVMAPAISVTSPSNTTRSPMMESDAPLLDSTDAHSDKGRLLDPSGSPITRNRNRLTSTPREDTDFDAMESSFRSEQRTKPADYGPFSPESLDATEFTGKGLHLGTSSRASGQVPPRMGGERMSGENGDDSVFQMTGVQAAEQPTAALAVAEQQAPARLSVDEGAWNHFMEESYPRRQQSREEEPAEMAAALDHSDQDLPLLRDSGIARPSFGCSVDVLGSTFAVEDSANREWMDDLSLVARMWNEELAAALALDSNLLIDAAGSAQHQLNASLTDTDPNSSRLELSGADLSGISVTSSSPSKQSYFCYDRIDEDIRQEEEAAAARRLDLSTIREEEADGDNEAETGRSLISQLQMKSRIQRHLELTGASDASDSCSEDGREDDEDEEVLVVDLENKRAVMLDGHSPKLKAAIVSQDYDPIFGGPPQKKNGLPQSEESNQSDEEDGGNGFAVDDDDDDDDEEDDEGDGIEASNFVWQACYPAKLNQPFSMEVIEEECEEEGEDEPTETFVPSTWRADATPTRPAMRNSSPEKSIEDPTSPKKNVSFSQSKRKEVYQYPVEEVPEEELPSPGRRQWGAPVSPVLVALQLPTRNSKESNIGRYADLADWDFSVEEDGQVVNDSGESEDVPPRLAKPVRPSSLPSHPLTSSVMYRLSGVDDDVGDEEETSQEAAEQRENEEFFQGNWPLPFGQDEFKPDQFFPDWDGVGGKVDPSSSPPHGAKAEENRQEMEAKAADVQTDSADPTRSEGDGEAA